MELETISKHSDSSTTLPALHQVCMSFWACTGCAVVRCFPFFALICDKDLPQRSCKCSSHHNSPCCLPLRKPREWCIRAQKPPGKPWIWLSLPHTSGDVLRLTADFLLHSTFNFFFLVRNKAKNTPYLFTFPQTIAGRVFFGSQIPPYSHGFHPHKTLEVKRRKCKEGNSTLLHLIQ